MTPQYKKFRDTLDELFMLDHAELDFGIYRIMNQKRSDIADYLDNQLEKQVTEELTSSSAVGGNAESKELSELEATLRKAGLSDEEIAQRPNVQELKAKLKHHVDPAVLEDEVYNHLSTFFKRYYDGGDFMSMRRYKKDVYAIPYEGEEVKLHWANSDQYYIKTSEYFQNYTFKADDKTIHFALRDASTEQNNNKAQGDKERRFKICDGDFMTIENDELTIWFTYEPMPKSVKQPALMKDALEVVKSHIIEHNNWAVTLLRLMPTEKNKARTLLEKHLNDYVSRNSFDYFIHKDLGGFLRRELDFYIKNEVLFIDDISTEEPERFLTYLSQIKTIKSIGEKLITFLAQLEDFQKKLWLKKKFVVESNYCITLDRLPKELYAEIAYNDRQREEWVRLFAIDEIAGGVKKGEFAFGPAEYTSPLSIEFLEQNQFLVLDTAFFDDEFKHRLIASIDNIDEQLDGTLINSENFQALNLLQEKYQNNVDSIYIDPPYNTSASEILYKNSYKHSSWLSLIHDRLLRSHKLISRDGLMCYTIDDFEFEKSKLILDSVFGVENVLGVIPIRNNPSGRSTAKGVSIAHEYALFYGKSEESEVGRLERNEKQQSRYNEQDEKGVFEWTNFRKHGGMRTDAPTMYYPIFISSAGLRIPAMEYDDSAEVWNLLDSPLANEKIIYPIDENGLERRWKWGYDRTISNLSEFCVRPDRTGELGVYVKTRTKNEGVLPLTWWDKKEYSATAYGTNILKDIFGDLQVFSYPKSVFAVTDCIKVLNTHSDSKILDFFAGSGTTAHAVINLNREDNGKRKYMLVEMGTYFDTVTKPRVQKVIYSKDWKDGKPVSREGSSHCFKYLRLESYEDTLNNLITKAGNDIDAAFKSDYLLGYMLDTETRGSLFNKEWFVNPFDVSLKITKQNELQEQRIDLIETFNYLIGLNVEAVQYPKEGLCVIEGVTRRGEKTLVLWRNCSIISNEELNKALRKLSYNTLDTEFDTIYVNGDNTLQNQRRDEEHWKVNLIEEAFASRMFEN